MTPRAKICKSLIKTVLPKLWSQVVRIRDGLCILCGSDKGLNAHHWIVHARGSLATRFIIDNGVALCYSCHIFKVHSRADAFYLDKIKSYMGRFISEERYEEIKRLGNSTCKMDVEKLEEIKVTLSNMKSYLLGTLGIVKRLS